MKLYEIFGIGGNALGFGGGSGGGSNPFASGGITLNVLPKSNGAGALADSSITDNGTNVSTTEGIIGVAGTASVPTYAYTGGASYGTTFIAGQGEIGISVNGNYRYGILNSEFRIGASSILTFSSANDPTGTAADSFFGRRGAANFRLGATDVNGVPVAQTLSVQNAITGSNLNAAAAFTLAGPLGTGTGTPGQVVVTGGDSSVATGTTSQTGITRLVLNATKALTTGAATTLVSIPLASLQMAGGYIEVYMEATDGTNQATRSEEVYYSAENSAGVFVTSASVVGTGVTACTATKTLTATYALTGANPALLQVTPTLGGITATRFTCIYEVHHLGNTNPTV